MPRHIAVIKCKYLGISDVHGGQRLMCLIEPYHPNPSRQDTTFTSSLKMVDFERGMAVTQNNIYVWDVAK